MYGDISASRVQFGEEGSNPSRSSLLTFSELGDRTTPSGLMAGRPTLVAGIRLKGLVLVSSNLNWEKRVRFLPGVPILKYNLLI